MASTLALVVYSLSSGRHRRYHIPSDDAEFTDPRVFIAPGEGAIVTTQASLRDLGVKGVIARHLNIHLTAVPDPVRSAIVRDEVVENIIMVDPDIDVIPDHLNATLVQSDTLQIGDKFTPPRG